LEKLDPSKNGSSTSGNRLRFEKFVIDPANRTLLRDGTELKMTGKDFDLLVFFALNPVRLLRKDELLAAVWPGSFVEECNLARHVSTLRKLLDDTDKEHKFIATVQGKGYRFLAEVESGSAEPQSLERPTAGVPYRLSMRRRSGPVAAAAAVVVLTLGVIWSASLLLRNDAARLNDVRPIKLTQDGNVHSPVISPDGKYLAYVCAFEGTGQSICIRQISTGSSLQIVPGRKGVPRWGTGIDPGNEFVYFISKDEGVDHGVLYRVPLFGGTPQKLGELVSGYSASPDGSRLVLIKRDVDAGQTSIVTIQNDGTDERLVLSTDLESAYYSVGWSPDGRNILYSVRRQTADGELRYVAEIPSEGGLERRMNVAARAQIFNIQWLPDKSGLIAAATDEETRQRQLYFITYPEGELHRLTNDVQGFNSFSMTADGNSGVASRTYDNRRIWIIPADGLGEPTAITSDTEKHFDSVEWAGGDYLVFDQDENSSYKGRNIWRMRPDGSERKQLTFGESGNTQPTLSPDGRMIAFVSYRTGKSQLWRMDIDGGGLMQLTELPHNISKPRFTHNGQYIYFDAWVNGMNQVWRCSPDGRDPAPVIEGVDVRAWTVSPDGSRIAYSYFDRGSGKVEARLRDAGMSGLGEPAGFLSESWMEWSRDGRSIYYNMAHDGARNIWRKDLGAAQPSQVTRFTDESLFDCSWSPDGGRAVCIRQMLTSDAVMIRF
jgi:Tol biopolymer transport system component/DNA-binding winged helix-turn-helix (wHTH) protein